MIIKDVKLFHLTIDDIKYTKNENGDIFISEFTGYGPILIPRKKKVILYRAVRKPVFTMSHDNLVLHIDARDYLKNHLKYLKEKEEDEIKKEFRDEEKSKIIKKFDDFEKKSKKGDQLNLF